MRISISSSDRLSLREEESFLFRGYQFLRRFKTLDGIIKNLYLPFPGEVLIKCPS